MASTTTIPEVSTTEGPEDDDARAAESAITAESVDAEEETQCMQQDAVEAGRSVARAQAARARQQASRASWLREG